MKYVKLIDNRIEYVPKNKGSILNYDLDIEQMLGDGYKPFVEVERPQTNRFYHIEYSETDTEISEVIVYDETQEEADTREFNAKKEQFEREFFFTSLGYIRRQVAMKDGSHKDFLSDLLPTISMAVQMKKEVKVIAYDMPDFAHEVTDWTQYQHNEIVTSQFIQECMLQQSADFGVANEAIN